MYFLLFRFSMFLMTVFFMVACERDDPMKGIADEVIKKGHGIEIEFKPVEEDSNK